LTGQDDEQHLGDEIVLKAPGLAGHAELAEDVPALLTPSGKGLHHALANSGLNATQHILLTHTSPATGDVTITVPPPQDGRNAVLMLVHDSTGALSWHLPGELPPVARRFEDGAAGAAPSEPPTSLQFTIPASRFAAGHEHVGLLSRIAGLADHFRFHTDVPNAAHKVISVLEYPVEHLVGMTGGEWFARWEANKHPAVIRWFPPTGGLKVGEPLSPTNWQELAAGPTLLFLHGIFSTCAGAFGALGEDDRTWPELRRRYGGRIIGYDHPTASVSPKTNAEWFLQQIPNVNLELDVVCHSRGGLVARSMAAQSAGLHTATRSVNVRNIVFAATPNGGSQITVTRNWVALINRLTSVMTLPAKILPAPVDEVTEVLAGLMEVLKIVAVGLALSLPGLEDMAPGSAFLNELAQAPGPPPQYFAAAADFEPGPLLANLFNRLDDLARVVDDEIFSGVHNDIAVPTRGIWDPVNPNGRDPAPDDAAIPGFPIPEGRRLAIGPGSVYWHCSYFHDQALRDALVEWLEPDTAPPAQSDR
jgi:hypothetical protein